MCPRKLHSPLTGPTGPRELENSAGATRQCLQNQRGWALLAGAGETACMYLRTFALPLKSVAGLEVVRGSVTSGIIWSQGSQTGPTSDSLTCPPFPPQPTAHRWSFSILPLPLPLDLLPPSHLLKIGLNSKLFKNSVFILKFSEESPLLVTYSRIVPF